MYPAKTIPTQRSDSLTNDKKYYFLNIHLDSEYKTKSTCSMFLSVVGVRVGVVRVGAPAPPREVKSRRRLSPDIGRV
jgi:hypothetical protein